MTFVVVLVLVALVGAAAAGAWWWFRLRPDPVVTRLRELIDQAEQLPPSPTRTVVRLRVELEESIGAAEVAADAAGTGVLDLSMTVRRLREASGELDADLATMATRGDAALGPVVTVLRGRVRELQSVADRVVVLARDAAADAARGDLRSMHEALDHELNVLDAHRELGGA